LDIALTYRAIVPMQKNFVVVQTIAIPAQTGMVVGLENFATLMALREHIAIARASRTKSGIIHILIRREMLATTGALVD
jgi:hypothetical protein